MGSDGERLWQRLAWSESLYLQPDEKAAIAPALPEIIREARNALTPASPIEVAASLAMLAALPSAGADEITGKAAVAGYQIALDDMPGDLLALAVRRALRDTARRFRPTPGELRGYVEEEMAERRRRVRRLEQIAANARAAA